MEVKYQGFNNYTIWLYRKDASNNRVKTSFDVTPIIRITDECRMNTYSYCGQVDGDTIEGNDMVEPMVNQNDGVYSFTVNFGGKAGSFVPLIYYEYDDKININKFLSGASMKKSQGYEEGISTALSAANVTVDTETITDGNKQLYSFLLYSSTAGAQTIGFTHNNCMTLKINGASLYTSNSNCSQTITANGQLTYTFEANKRYYVEAMVTQVTATTDLNLGFGAPGSITDFTTGNVMRPLIFTHSSNKNIRFGQGGYDETSTIPYAFIFVMTGISLVVALGSSVLMGKKINAAYSIIHHIQLLILTPIIGVTIGVDVEQFYNLIDFFLFNFNWLGKRIIYTTNNDVKPSAGFFQANRYFSLIGLESASAFYNIGQLVFVLFVLFGVSLILAWIYILFLKKENSKVKKIVTWVFDLVHFTLFIRLFLLSFTFVLLSAFSEVSISNDNFDEGGSWAFAF